MTTMNVSKTIDGERNLVLFVNIVVDGDGDLPLQTLVDMSTVSQPLDITYKRCKCDRIEFDVEDQLEVDLYWEDALVPAGYPLWRLTGRGRVNSWAGGSVQNTAPNRTGNVLIQTQGWTPGAMLSASFQIEFGKQQ